VSLKDLSLGFALFAATAAPAAAACVPSNLAGSWSLRASTGTACAILADRKGTISRSSCRYKGYRGTLSGKLTLAKSCDVGGTLTLKYPGQTEKLSVRGRMDGAKSKISGSGSGPLTGRFTFTAVKG